MTDTILCIGQSDSSSGTGVQGDLKTAQAHGLYATSVITSVKAQNTLGVQKSYVLPTDMIAAQIEAVLSDFEPKVIKLGMLGSTEIIDLVGDFLDEKASDAQVVIDPVMTNRAGDSLLDKEAKDALKRRLLIHADVFTPNVSETSDLSGGIEVLDVEQLAQAAEMLHTLGARVVIAKGADLPGDTFVDIYHDENGGKQIECQRSETKNTHGAGTTLATGIACGLAKGMNAWDAFEKAHKFMTAAVEAGPKYGKGKNGPLNHMISGF